MTKTATRPKRRNPRDTGPRPTPPPTDRAIYLGIIIVGFFTVMLGGLMTEPHYWPHVAIVYMIVIAYLININVFRAYRGTLLSDFGTSLARIPLRFVGFGTKEGKPIEAAHGHSEVKTAMFISIVVSIIIIAAFAAILIPGFIR